MEKGERLILNKEVELIYEKLVNLAIHDCDGVYWKSESFDNSSQVSENIYSGCSGILLFLIEYYKYAKNHETETLISKCANWLESFCINNKSKNLAFYTGRIGTVYAIVRARMILNDERGVERAFDLLKELEFKESAQSSNFDFLNGLAGSLMGLLHIYDLGKLSSIKAKVLEAANRLIEGIKVREYGFYWNKTGKMIQPLCGFSHGTSGISFVFLELGNYFNEPFFYEIAKRGMDYEDHFYDEIKNNWPDFRKGYFKEEEEKWFVEQYTKGNLSFFEKPAYMTAWCHGSPGIGLARFRASNLLLNSNYEERVDSILHELGREKANSHYSSTWCHGLLGNNILFLEKNKKDRQGECPIFFMKSCMNSIEIKNQLGYYRSGLNYEKEENLSLFLGISGIGYSYIQALSSDRVFSPLFPILGSQSGETLTGFKADSAIVGNWKRRFPYTIEAIENSIECEMFDFNDLNREYLPEIISDKISKNLELKKIYELEILRNKGGDTIKNFALQNIRKVVNHRYFIQAWHANFSNCFLTLNPELEFLQVDGKSVIFYPDVTDYRILEIDDSVEKILSGLKTKKSFDSLISEMAIKNPHKVIEYLVKEGIIIVEYEN